MPLPITWYMVMPVTPSSLSAFLRASNFDRRQMMLTLWMPVSRDGMSGASRVTFTAALICASLAFS